MHHRPGLLDRADPAGGNGAEVRLAGAGLPVRDPLAPTVFHQPWWLDAVAPGGWQQVEAREGGRVIGRFPFAMQRVLGPHRLCGMPPMTHFLGPGIDEGSGGACTRLLKRSQIARALLGQLPPASGFWHKLHRGTGDTLPFQELGYETGVQFTFEVAPAAETLLWAGMRDKTRNVIRRAGERLLVESMADLEAFAAFYQANLVSRGDAPHHPPALIVRACRAAVARGQGQVLAAIDASGTPAAAIFCIWDADAAYYLLSTRRETAHNGAVALLVWHAMRDAAGRGLVFDFEGVVTAGSALFFAGFGGVTAPRFVVSRHSLGHRLAGRLRNPWRRRGAAVFLK